MAADFPAQNCRGRQWGLEHPLKSRRNPGLKYSARLFPCLEPGTENSSHHQEYPSSASQSNHVVQLCLKPSLPIHHVHPVSDCRISPSLLRFATTSHHLLERSKTTPEDKTPQVQGNAPSLTAQATFSTRRRRFTSFLRADKTDCSKRFLNTN